MTAIAAAAAAAIAVAAIAHVVTDRYIRFQLTETVRQALAMLVLSVLRQRRRLCRAHELGAADLADDCH